MISSPYKRVFTLLLPFICIICLIAGLRNTSISFGLFLQSIKDMNLVDTTFMLNSFAEHFKDGLNAMSDIAYNIGTGRIWELPKLIGNIYVAMFSTIYYVFDFLLNCLYNFLSILRFVLGLI